MPWIIHFVAHSKNCRDIDIGTKQETEDIKVTVGQKQQ